MKHLLNPQLFDDNTYEHYAPKIVSTQTNVDMF